jgi:hypothetical protein
LDTDFYSQERESHFNEVKKGLVEKFSEIFDGKMREYMSYKLTSVNQEILKLQNTAIIRVKSMVLTVGVKIQGVIAQNLVFPFSDKYLFNTENQNLLQHQRQGTTQEEESTWDQFDAFFQKEVEKSSHQDFLLVRAKQTCVGNLMLPVKYLISILILNARSELGISNGDLMRAESQ